MKPVGILILILTATIHTFGQRQQNVFLASLSGAERMSLIKTSVEIPSWHEKSFWPLYEKYRSEIDDVSLETYRSLDDLARTNFNATDEEAFQNAQKLLRFRQQELTLKQQYYAAVSREFNGIVAFQFLQAETLLDLMQSSDIYEKTPWRIFKFHPAALSSTEFKSAKYNVIANALALTEDKAEAFYLLYASYEMECDALLGENYDIISLYAGKPSDYTPALAKQLGYNLMTLMLRENKLKEKYFQKMNEAVGSKLAARFLTWEDYYSLMSKMYAWAETP
jgi:hypothetical protein